MSTIKLNRRFLLILIGVSVFSLVAVAVDIHDSKPAGLEIVSTESDDPQSPISETDVAADVSYRQKMDDSALIPVYLVGAIQKPGIYQVRRGSYLYELVEQAGGLSADAASEEINLALAIQENCHIRIPTLAELANNTSSIQIIQQRSSKETLQTNINTASLEELDLLPGIGPATAKAIIDYRERNGAFAVIEDLMNVSGIKQSRLDTIRDLISVS